MCYNYDRKVRSLTSELVENREKLVDCKGNALNLKGELLEQNKAIELVSNDYITKVEELEKWRARPREVLYKEVIKIEEAKTDDCKDIKDLLDHIRATGF
jgi:hypothetical protein